MGNRANYLQYFCRKILVKGSLGRYKHRREYNIKMYSQKYVGAWIGMNKDKWRNPVNTVINYGVP